MRVLHASSELYPLVSTGGLSSVAAALPAALRRYGGVETAAVLPYYREAAAACPEVRWLPRCSTFLEEDFGLGLTEISGLQVFLVARDEYFDRKGIYGAEPGSSWPDNPERFSFFSRAVASIACSPHFRADAVHCHDWQTALVPVYLREGPTASVLTIHNLQFQGRFGSESWGATGLPDTLYNTDALEFWGDWNCLKGGIVFADGVTTVSPGYSREILTEEYGCALDGVLREHSGKLTGILNGIDVDAWDPSTDPVLPAGYSTGDIKGKRKCRRALEMKTGLFPDRSGLLLGMVSRLTTQKGIDLVVDAADAIAGEGHRLAVLGTGEPWAEKALMEAAAAWPGRISVTIAYDDALARLIFAGSDGFLMPSRFEPCGLAQMTAMRYGSVPLVSSVGGLADTVDGKKGFTFSGGLPGFLGALEEMGEVWRDRRRWSWLRRRGMATDFSWRSSVKEYVKVYERALGAR